MERNKSVGTLYMEVVYYHRTLASDFSAICWGAINGYVMMLWKWYGMLREPGNSFAADCSYACKEGLM